MAVATELPAPSDRPVEPPSAPAIRGVDGALAGAVAAGVALAAGELVCGIGGSQPSLITAVGTQFIDRFAASLKDLAIALFGTNDKVALIVGIVVVSLVLGAVLGRASLRRPLVGVVGFAVFGAVGLFSYLDDPLGEPVVGVIAAVVATAAGIGTLFGLLHLLHLGRGAARQPAATSSSRGGSSSCRPGRSPCWPSALRSSAGASAAATSSSRHGKRPSCRRRSPRRRSWPPTSRTSPG